MTAKELIDNNSLTDIEVRDGQNVVFSEIALTAINMAREEGANNLIEQSVSLGITKYQAGLECMKWKAIKAFKENCQHPKDTKGCECKLCVRYVGGHCELLDGFIEKLNSKNN